MSSTTNSGEKLLSYSIDIRLRFLINEVTRGRADWKALQHKTGVSAEKWRNFNRGATKSSSEMIEAVSKEWPQYAFWLVTGVSDEHHGHHAATPYLGFPRLGSCPSEKSTEDATSYFRDCANAIEKIWPRALNAISKPEEISWDLIETAFFQGLTLNAQTTVPPIPKNIITQLIEIQRQKEVALIAKWEKISPTEVADSPRIKWQELKGKKINQR